MAAQQSPEETAQRIEEVLDALNDEPNPDVRAAGEELVRLLMRFYGAGLARLMALLRAPEATTDPETTLRRLVDDELVAALLALHDLHPVDLRQRVGTALDEVTASLHVEHGTLEVAEVDSEHGVLRLRIAQHGCPSTVETIRRAAEGAVARAAPEVARIELLGTSDAGQDPVLQIMSRPPEGWRDSEVMQ